MRAFTDAIAFYEREKATDLFGFMLAVLLTYLPFDLARPYLKPEAMAAEWNADLPPFTPAQVAADALDYMAFAWGKVLDHRGLSAGRSIQKFKMWCYLLGEDELVARCDDDRQYPMYGAPILLAICTTLGWPVPVDDRAARMAAGKPCRDDCDEGCGTK
jgi:hypothetical protein